MEGRARAARGSYAIDAATNRGYRLSQDNDLLSPASIERFLSEGHPFAITVRKRVDSTNAEARRRALEGAPEGTVIVAEEQWAGRGRPGKRFFSPAGSGVYLSVVLKPRISADQGQLITCAAAVAGARAIERMTGQDALIKWVNDIYMDGRKVAGILTEGVVDMESGRFEHAVMGIGVNNTRSSVRAFPANWPRWRARSRTKATGPCEASWPPPCLRSSGSSTRASASAPSTRSTAVAASSSDSPS